MTCWTHERNMAMEFHQKWLAYRLEHHALLLWIKVPADDERHHWNCVLRRLFESASGNDVVFDPDVRVLVVEPGR